MVASSFEFALGNSLLRRPSTGNLDPERILTGPHERVISLSSPMKGATSPKVSISAQSHFGFWRRLLRNMQVPFFIFWAVCCFKVATDAAMRLNTELRNNLLYETFLYYNPLFLVAVMIWLWGVNIWVFMVCRIFYAKVFELDNNHLSHWDIWMVASWVTFIVLTSMTSYMYLSSQSELSLAASQPVLLYSALPLMMVLPVDVFYVSSRIFFLRTLVRILFPFQPISFTDFFVADILTSMAKVLSDMERATCRMFHGQVATLSWFEPDSTCGSHSIWIPCVLALPYACRFFQCLRQFGDTRDRNCIFNALKYATAFPVILLSALKYHVADALWIGWYRPLWLFSSLVNTCFSFYWDIRRDWDLSLFSGLYNAKHPMLRANLLYSHHWIYYGAIGSNFLLRCAWTYKLSAHLRHNYITVFLMTSLEMFRRFLWIFFRVENEYNKMINRVAAQSSFKDSSKEAELLLSSYEHNV